MNRKTLYITLLAIVLLFTAFEETRLRPYLLRHHIHTFYIADSLPNFLAVLIPFFVYSVLKYPMSLAESLKATAAFVIAMILYELAQPFMEHRTFDVIDILASVLGGVVCCAVAWLLPAKVFVVPQRVYKD